MVNQQKSDQVQSLIDTISQSENFAVVKFEKTLHTTLEALRKELRANGASFSVIKNTLFTKAINKLSAKDKKFQGLKDLAANVKENSALLLLRDEWSKGLSAFYKFSDKEKTLFFKFGFLDSTVYESSDLEKIAKLPSREVLLAKVIGSMKTPISKLNYSLKFNMQKFVYVLSEGAKGR